MDSITTDIIKSIDKHISSKQYGIEENNRALEHLLDTLASHLQDFSSRKKEIPFAKEVVDAILCISKMHMALDFQSKTLFKMKRNYRIETLIFEILNNCASVNTAATLHLKALCYPPKIFALFASSDDYRFQEVSGEFLWRILRGENDGTFLATFSFAGLEEAPLSLTQDHSSSLARIFCSIKEKNLQSDLECFITSFNESLNENQKVYSFTLVEMMISTTEKTEKFCAVEVFFSTSRRITFRVDDGNLYEFDFTLASLMDQNALEKLSKTKEITFSVNSNVALPGFPPRSEEDFYSLSEDVVLKMEFQRNDTKKATDALEKILFSTTATPSSSLSQSQREMEVEKESPKSNNIKDNNNNKPSLSLRKSHNSISLSQENTMGLDSVFTRKQKDMGQITRKSSFVAMMIGQDYQEFDPHPQGSIISSLGEVLVPALASEKMRHKGKRNNNIEDSFNDIMAFSSSYSSTPSYSSSSSSESKSSTNFDDISPIKPRPGEINDRDMLKSLSPTPSPLSHKNRKLREKEKEKENKNSDEESDKKLNETPPKKQGSKKALTVQKKKSSPSKIMLNSLNAHKEINLRRERKNICDLYVNSRAHFVLLEKAMQDTTKELSIIRQFVSKAAKTMQRMHRACKYQNRQILLGRNK